MAGFLLGAIFVVGVIVLGRVLRHRERDGDWDIAGRGTPEHKTGLQFRPLESGPWD